MNSNRPSQALVSFLAGILVFCSIFQAAYLLNSYTVLWLKRAYRTMSLPSMERNALNLVGSKGARFLEFLSSSVPFDKPVVVPEGYGELSEQSILQFFLMPRGIPGCFCRDSIEAGVLTENCRECLLKDEHSIPAIGLFPPDDLVAFGKDFIQFEDANWYRGVYVPPGSQRNSKDIYIEMDFPLILAAILDISAIVLFVLHGLMIGYLLDRSLTRIEYLSLAIPLSTGFLTWCVFITSWIGFQISLLMYFVYLVVPIVVFAVVQRTQLSRFSKTLITNVKSNLVERPRNFYFHLLLGGFAFLAFTSILISVARGYSIFDGIANWALKGYGIALERSVFAGNNWGGHGLSYPQNIHIQIAFFRLLDGDVLPGSKLLFPMFGLSLLGGGYAFLRRHRISSGFALLHALAIFSIPFFYLHTTLGWGNLILSTYLILAVYYLVVGLMTGSVSKYLIGGSLLAFAAWTRPEGIGYAFAFVVLFSISQWKARRRLSFRWIIPLLVLPATWLTFSLRAISSDEIGEVLRAFSYAIMQGDFRFVQLGSILHYAWTQWTDVATWGFLLYSLPILFIATLIRLRRRLIISTLLVASGGLISISIPIFMFFVASFSKEDMSQFLWASFNRSQFHGLILIYTSLFLNAFSSSDEVDSSSLVRCGV